MLPGITPDAVAKDRVALFGRLGHFSPCPANQTVHHRFRKSCFQFVLVNDRKGVLKCGGIGGRTVLDRGISQVPPITSDKIKLISRAGYTIWARPPPLTFDRCFRTQLTSSMPAPDASGACVVLRFWSRLMPSAGRQNRDDPPPEIRWMISVCSSAARPYPSKCGPLSGCFHPARGGPFKDFHFRRSRPCPYFVMTNPEVRSSSRMLSMAEAMRAEPCRSRAPLPDGRRKGLPSILSLTREHKLSALFRTRDKIRPRGPPPERRRGKCFSGRKQDPRLSPPAIFFKQLP